VDLCARKRVKFSKRLASRRVAEKVGPTPEKEVRVYAIHKGDVA
jgi:hypothetical protein